MAALLNTTIRIDTLIAQAHEMIDRAMTEQEISGFYALFSGGHDSYVNAHIASQHKGFRGVIHINTGTGIPDTFKFVKAVSDKHKWDLKIAKPFDTYESLLVRFGFPGPAAHAFMYQYLKDRPLVSLIQGVKSSDKGGKKWRVGLTTGVRRLESDRRMIDARFDGIHRDGSRVWIPPIKDFSAFDVSDYMKANDLNRNPVKALLHISGECNCGAMSKTNERKDIETWFPEFFQNKILRWEKLVAMARELNPDRVAERHCQWGHGDGANTPKNQIELFPMCHYCKGRSDHD